jgi:hypothetical protein
MAGPDQHYEPAIDKRDFDDHRPLLHDIDAGVGGTREGRPRSDSRLSAIRNLDGGSDGLLNNVVDEIVERDRRKMAMEVMRVCSFVVGVLSWLAVPFLAIRRCYRLTVVVNVLTVGVVI